MNKMLDNSNVLIYYSFNLFHGININDRYTINIDWLYISHTQILTNHFIKEFMNKLDLNFILEKKYKS